MRRGGGRPRRAGSARAARRAGFARGGSGSWRVGAASRSCALCGSPSVTRAGGTRRRNSHAASWQVFLSLVPRLGITKGHPAVFVFEQPPVAQARSERHRRSDTSRPPGPSRRAGYARPSLGSRLRPGSPRRRRPGQAEAAWASPGAGPRRVPAARLHPRLESVPEGGREHPHRQQVRLIVFHPPTLSPLGAIFAQSAAGHDVVDMRMISRTAGSRYVTPRGTLTRRRGASAPRPPL